MMTSSSSSSTTDHEVDERETVEGSLRRKSVSAELNAPDTSAGTSFPAIANSNWGEERALLADDIEGEVVVVVVVSAPWHRSLQ
jgi:hypothetical protein